MAKTPPQDQPEAGTGEVTTQSGEQYTTRGQVRLATRQGYRFRPSNKDLPEITPEGVNMSRENADAVLDESDQNDGFVFEVTDDNEEA